jgi:TonB family protein
MKTVTVRRVLALFGYVSCLAAGPVAAQVGPIQPVLITEGKAEVTHNRPDFDDYSIPLDVYVAADGAVTNVVVSDSSGNVAADGAAASLMREKRFLPALDAKGQPVNGMVKVAVNMYKRGTRKVVHVTVKPPPIAAETQRVKKLMCADFLWEVDRIRDDAGIRDASLEVMPYTSARMYMQQKNVSSEVEEKFWDMWPNALRKAIDRCEKEQTSFYFTEVLVPLLDGAMPAKDTELAASTR